MKENYPLGACRQFLVARLFTGQLGEVVEQEIGVVKKMFTVSGGLKFIVCSAGVQIDMAITGSLLAPSLF